MKKVPADTPPKFQGGDVNSFAQWVAQHLRYPAVAREIGVQGKVTVQFTVGTDGYLRDVTVLRSVEASLDKEAVRVVSSSPQWTPGVKNGRTVTETYTMPVVFQLH